MTQSSLVIASHEPDAGGELVAVTSEQAGWRDLCFAARRLPAGGCFDGATGASELALVLLGGRATVESSAGRWEGIGKRRTVFDGMPFALYLPPGVAYTVMAETELDLALAWCPAEPQFPARLVTPQDVAVEVRGGGNATRQINHILPAEFPAQRLLVVEVYTPGGNWSSYPPHKHDVHDPPPRQQSPRTADPSAARSRAAPCLWCPTRQRRGVVLARRPDRRQKPGRET